MKTDTRQVQTLVNGKGKEVKWTVPVGPHRDSMIWGEGLNTDLVEHLGCGGVRKVRQPSPPIRGAEDGEEARAVAGE